MSRHLTAPARLARPRRVLLALVAALLAASVAVVPHASAADPVGTLQVKSVGSLYSAATSGPVVAVVGAGGAATYSVKVVNPGASAADYRLRVAAGTAATAATVPGGLFGKTLVAGADGYPVTAVPAHGSTVVTLKITPPKTTPQQTLTATATLAGVGGADLDVATLLTSIKAAKGHTAYSLMVSSSSSTNQVGGDVSGQSVSAAAVPDNKTTSFKVVVRNDSKATTTVRLVTAFSFCSAPGFLPIHLKAGGYGDDIIISAYNPGLVLKLLPGQSKSYTLSFERRDSARTPCPQYGGTIAVMRADDPTYQWLRTVEVIAHPAV